MNNYSIDYWRNSFPHIDWDEPVMMHILRPDGETITVFGCRVCIANEGLKAGDVIDNPDEVAVFELPDHFIEHMATRHA